MAKTPKQSNAPVLGSAVEFGAIATQRFARGNVAMQSGRYLDPKTMDNFIERRTAFHEIVVRETEQTARLGLKLGAASLALAALVVIFAPTGREILAAGAAIAFIVFGAGAAGFTSIRASLPGAKVEAGMEGPT